MRGRSGSFSAGEMGGVDTQEAEGQSEMMQRIVCRIRSDLVVASRGENDLVIRKRGEVRSCTYMSFGINAARHHRTRLLVNYFHCAPLSTARWRATSGSQQMCLRRSNWPAGLTSPTKARKMGLTGSAGSSARGLREPIPQPVTEGWEQTSTSGVEGLQTPPLGVRFSESRHRGAREQSLASQRSEHWAELTLI
jgi:hypothetical protein